MNVVSGRIAHYSGVFFWVWTRIALDVTDRFRHSLGARTVDPAMGPVPAV